MSDDTIYKKIDRMLGEQVRVASESTASRLVRTNRNLFNEGRINQDLKDIDQVLSDKNLTLSNDVKARLYGLQGRNLSSLLIMKEKFTGDSSHMKKVKQNISALEVRLNRRKTGKFTVADIDSLLEGYNNAILACTDYLLDKDPSFKKSSERYELVEKNNIRLLQEASHFRAARELIKNKIIDGNFANAHMLLVAAKVYDLTKPENGPGEAERREAPKEADIKGLGLEGGLLYNIFSGKETPSDLIARMAKSKNKKEKQMAQTLPFLINNILSSLNRFKEGKAVSKVFVFEKSVLSLTQNTAGQLTFTAGNKSVFLDRNTGILADALATDIVKNEKKYRKLDSERIIRRIIKNKNENAGNITKHRETVLSFLQNRTGHSRVEFNNIGNDQLYELAKTVLDGKKIDDWILVENEQGKVDSKEAFLRESDKRFITSNETRTLLKKTMDQKNREDVENKVVLEKGEEIQVKRDEPVWEEKEEKMKDLLADIVFSSDTWVADELKDQPGKRMQAMLLKNSEALAYILSDIITKGDSGSYMKFLDSTLEKLPLFMLEKKQVEDFRKMLSQSVEQVLAIVNKKITDKISEGLKEIDGVREEMERKKEEERKKKEKEEEEGGFGFGFASGLKSFLLDIGSGFVQSVAKNSAETVKQQVLKALSDPKTLINGTEIMGQEIPSIKSMIEDMDNETLENLSDAEKKIDEGVTVASDTIQETVKKYSKDLFKPEERKEYEEIPDVAHAESEEDRLKKLKKKIKIENDMLTDMVKDSMIGGKSGQGLFTQFVFENYFKNIDLLDKRAMIGSMIKNAKPMGKLLDENEKGISEEEKLNRKNLNEKTQAEAMGNYIGGLLKGAGPLFQKMMQGLPMEGLPTELKGAVSDMKSKLSPIPREVVEAELYSMVERSHNQIKKIVMRKPLGAASVGQTFLCRITKADGTEEDAVVKLLRPDVKNRMEREKNIMIQCARMTDQESRKKDRLPKLKANEKGGMQVTYEGQLSRIEEEMDLTLEARNTELGKIYDKASKEDEKNVGSMKLNNLVEPTINSMVLEKAPGENFDELIKRTTKELDDLLEPYKRKDAQGNYVIRDGQIAFYGGLSTLIATKESVEKKTIKKGSKEYMYLHPAYMTGKLSSLLAELKTRKAYLDTFAEKWVREGVFGEGFYHGDPHAGNIMVDDEKLTVIDYGNCTKLTDDQQQHITRMLFASSVGDMETFRSDFHALLKPEFEDLYQSKRKELGDVIKKVFAMGDRHSAGKRIAVVLLKAQEMGLEVPPSVYNFSQSQIRLQNTIDEMNQKIEETEKSFITFASMNEEDSFDCSEDFQKKTNVNMDESMESIHKGYSYDLMIFSDNKEEMAEIFKKTPGEFMKMANISELLKEQKSVGEFKKDFLDIIDGMKLIPAELKENQANKEKFFRSQDANLDSIYIKCRNLLGPGLIKDIKACIRLEGAEQDAEAASIAQRIDKAQADFAALEEADRKLDVVADVNQRITRAHGGKFSPTDQEREEYNNSISAFLDTYMPIHATMLRTNETFDVSFKKLTKTYGEDEKEEKEQAEGERKIFFEQHPYMKEEFEKAFTEFHEAKKNNAENLEEKRTALWDVYSKVIAQRLREKKNACDKGDGKNKDFLDIMSDVIDKEFKTSISRLGFIKSISYKNKMEKQTAEENKMEKA